MSHTAPDTIMIRVADASDAGTVGRLAALDSAPVPAGSVLLAEVDGEARAALSLASDDVIADPFSRTADLATLLRMRASLLGAARHGERSRKLRIPLRRSSHDPVASAS